MYDILELNGKSLIQLKEIAREMRLHKTDHLKKQEIVSRILDAQASATVAAMEVEKEAEKETEKKLPEEGLRISTFSNWCPGGTVNFLVSRRDTKIFHAQELDQFSTPGQGSTTPTRAVTRAPRGTAGC